MQIKIEFLESKLVLEVEPNLSIHDLMYQIYHTDTKFKAELSFELFYKSTTLYTDNLFGEAVQLDMSKTLAEYKYQLAESINLSLVFLPIIEALPTIPTELFCPLSGAIFLDPVRLPCSTTVERSVIEKWIIQHGNSPFNRQPLSLENLVANEEVINHVNAFYKTYKNSVFFDALKEQQYKLQEQSIQDISAPSTSTEPSADDLLAIESALGARRVIASFNPTFFGHLVSISAEGEVNSSFQSPVQPILGIISEEIPEPPYTFFNIF